MLQQRKDPSLQFDVELVQEVAAADEVQFGKGWIPRDVMLDEDAKIANSFADTTAAFGALEEAGESLGGHAFKVDLAIEPEPRSVDCLLAQVGAEDLDRRIASL